MKDEAREAAWANSPDCLYSHKSSFEKGYDAGYLAAQSEFRRRVEELEAILADVQTITFMDDLFVEYHRDDYKPKHLQNKWEAYDAEQNPIPGQWDSLPEAYKALKGNENGE